MSEFNVLIAHALTTYVSTLAGFLSFERPHFRVQMVDPLDLDGALARVPGAFVVSDVLSPPARQSGAGWILYYPDQQDVAIVNIDGTEQTIENPALEDVLSALDHAAYGQHEQTG